MEEFSLQESRFPFIGVRTVRAPRIATMKTDRYATLQPNALCILTGCLEECTWDEMFEIFAKSGDGGTPTDVKFMAIRTRGVINPNSAHFREFFRTESLQGEIPHSELPNPFPYNIGKTKQQTRKRTP